MSKSPSEGYEIIEGDFGDKTPVKVCLELVGVHDGLQRNVIFLSIVTLNSSSRLYRSTVKIS